MIPLWLIKPLGIGILALAILASAALWLHEHDNAIRAEMQASIGAADAKAVEADFARSIAALEAADAKAALRAASDAQIRGAIHAAPVTTSCARSGAMRAVLSGLRTTGNGAGPAPTSPAKPIDLPRTTGAAK